MNRQVLFLERIVEKLCSKEYNRNFVTMAKRIDKHLPELYRLSYKAKNYSLLTTVDHINDLCSEIIC